MAITKTTRTYNYETKAYDASTETFAEGCVLEKFYESQQVMSDMWEQAYCARYWDPVEKRVKVDMWIDSAEVDATEEVKNAVRSWIALNAFNEAKERFEKEAQEKRKGSVVKVVKGRSDKGAIGKIVAIIERPYKMGYRSTMAKKYGIATSDVKIKVPAANGKVYENYKDVVWAWAFNTELVEVPEVNMADVEEVAKNLYQTYLRYNWKCVA